MPVIGKKDGIAVADIYEKTVFGIDDALGHAAVIHVHFHQIGAASFVVIIHAADDGNFPQGGGGGVFIIWIGQDVAAGFHEVPVPLLILCTVQIPEAAAVYDTGVVSMTIL